MPKKVNKSLDQSEISTLENIQSLIGELLQMNSGGVAEMGMEEDTMPNELETAMKRKQDEEINYEEKPKDDIQKGLETTLSDGATASDDVEPRLEDVQTEVTEENVSEVAKAIMQALNGNNKIRKSAKRATVSNKLLDAIGNLAQVQKANQERVQDIEQALYHLLDGLGVTKQLQVAEKSVQKSQPMTTGEMDNAFLLKEIRDALTVEKSSKNDNQYIANGEVVHKNLGQANVLGGLLGRTFKSNLNKLG